MLKNQIIEFITSDSYSPVSAQQLAEELNLPLTNDFFDILDGLEEDGTVIRGKKNRYFLSESIGLIKGIIRTNPKGFAFLANDDEDIYISENSLYGALNGDTVLVRLIKPTKKNLRSREGEVVRIIKRAETIIVGIYKQERAYGIVIPDNERLPREFFVAPSDAGGALNGQKVVAEIIEYESPTSSLQCRITEVLGFPYDFGVDVLSVIKSHGFSPEFPKSVLDECTKMQEADSSELSERLDLTKKLIITIDGDDTKDIDDAVSVEKCDNGYILGVHIADVSHYVLPSSAIDNEAYKRGTSVYLVDRVIPMLPFRLSNDLCSLNEGVIRLTMSVFMNIDNSGNITSASFHKSFIKSYARMTYNNVRLILEAHPEDLCQQYKDIVPMLEDMASLASLLRTQTKNRGAIDFNIPEAKAVFDKNGKTVDIVLRENTFANNIIEEFMIAANISVAKFLSENAISAIYRVHEDPDPEKLSAAMNFVKILGFNNISSVSGALAKAKGTPKEAAVSTMLLRSMAKARYDSHNLGHYGLMLTNYCHFTSPIRRYPDLICHRAIKAVLEKDEATLKKLHSFVDKAATNCSETELSAQLCERDTLDIKKAEYMESRIGEVFDGTISSVTGFGFFVMLPNTIEGLVRVESLCDDYYVYDDKFLTLTGERGGRKFSIGDNIKVKLVSADKISRRIDFVLDEKGGNKNAVKRKNKNTRTKQKRTSRVLHRRKNRSRH